MVDDIKKPQGTFAKLMSSSHIKVEQEQNSGKPENLKTGNQDYLKAVKYSTQLHKDTILRLKQFALVKDVKDYEVVEDAIIEYLDKRKSGNQENQKT